MPIKKENQYLGLDKLNVYQEDTESTSKYFKVSEIPETLPIGKSSFLIRGSKWLKSQTEIKVEVIDSKGGVIYSQFVTDVEQSNGRPVSIEVYDDTPVGPATIHIVGEIVGVPDKWRGIYNARWSKKIFVDPTNFNKQPIKFIKKPKLIVEEKNVYYRKFHQETTQSLHISSSLYKSGSETNSTFEDGGTGSVWDNESAELLILSDKTGMETAISHFPELVPNLVNKYGKDYLASEKIIEGGYSVLFLKGIGGSETGSFNSQMEGYEFRAKQSTFSDGQYYAQFPGLKEDYTGSIVSVYNDRLALIKPALKGNELLTGSFINVSPDGNVEYEVTYNSASAKLPSNFSNWIIDYKTEPSESLMTPETEGNESGFDRSYAAIALKNLKTYSGEVARVQVFTKQHRADFSEPTLIYDGILPSNNVFKGFNDPPRKLGHIGTFATSSDMLIGSSSRWEHWFKDKKRLGGVKNLTGTLTASNDSNQISGSGTSFTTELSASQTIQIKQGTYYQTFNVGSILNDISMSLSSSWQGNSTREAVGYYNIPTNPGTQDGYGNYSDMTASVSNDTFVNSVKLQGYVSSSDDFLRFYTSGSQFFIPGKWVFEANIHSKNPDGIPDNWPGTTLFVYLSGSAFSPDRIESGDDHYSGIEIPPVKDFGQPIASFNPQYLNGKLRSHTLSSPYGKNYGKVKSYFDISGSTGYGQLNFLVYNPNYETSQSKWTLSDIQVRPRKDAGYNPDGLRMFVPVDSELADDVLDFEVRYLNMDNDTAVEISKYENISFSGSDYNLASNQLFAGGSGNWIMLKGSGAYALTQSAVSTEGNNPVDTNVNLSNTFEARVSGTLSASDAFFIGDHGGNLRHNQGQFSYISGSQGRLEINYVKTDDYENVLESPTTPLESLRSQSIFLVMSNENSANAGHNNDPAEIISFVSIDKFGNISASYNDHSEPGGIIYATGIVTSSGYKGDKVELGDGKLILSSSGDITTTGDVITTGDIVAKNYIVSSSEIYITSSYMSGSSKWGNTGDDLHDFTGSIILNTEIGSSLGSTRYTPMGVALITTGSVSTQGNISASNSPGTVGSGKIGGYSLYAQDLSDNQYVFSNGSKLQSGNKIYHDSTNSAIGINTANVGPIGELGVKGVITSSEGYMTHGTISSSAIDGIIFNADREGNIIWKGQVALTGGDSNSHRMHSSLGKLHFQSGSDSNKGTVLSLVHKERKVGIGNPIPIQALTVEGSISASGDIYLKEDQKILFNSGDGPVANTLDDFILYHNNDYMQYKSNKHYFIGPIESNGHISSSGAFHTLSHITASGNISSSGTIYGEDAQFGSDSVKIDGSAGHITASGNISASGTIFAQTFQSGDGAGGADIDFSDGIDVTGNITASGDISSSGTIYASSIDNVNTTNITASGNISSSGTIIGNVGVIGTDTPATNMELTVDGDISASGNIFVEGNVTAQQFTTQIIESSFSSGSTAFGDTTDDTHIFSGSVILEGSISQSGDIDLGGNITASGNINVGGVVTSSGFHLLDNNKLTIGNDGDLEIYHNGSHTHLVDTGTGNFIIRGNVFQVKNASNSETMIQANEDEGVHLYYNNNQKLVTKTGGVHITGHISASADISASNFYGDSLYLRDSSRVDIKFTRDGYEDHYIRKDGDYLRFRGHDDSTVLFELQNNTNGGNESAFPNGKLGIGTSNPTRLLHLHTGSSDNVYMTFTNGTSGISAGSDGFDFVFTGTNMNFINRENGAIVFETNGTEQVRILNSGNFGIGTPTPTKKLTVVGDISASGDLYVSNSIYLDDGGGGYNDAQISVGSDVLTLSDNGSIDILMAKNTPNPQKISFGTGSSASHMDLMIISSSGDVIIGNPANKDHKLNVDGHIGLDEDLHLRSGKKIDWQHGDASIVEGQGTSYSLGFNTYDGSSNSEVMLLEGNNSASFTGNVTVGGFISASGDIITQGDVIAENYIVRTSVTNMTTSFSDGNTIFGNDLTDTHQFTGSVFTQGNLQISESKGIQFTTDKKSFISSSDGTYRDLTIQAADDLVFRADDTVFRGGASHNVGLLIKGDEQNVGIGGEANPTEPLVVKGNISASGDILLEGNISSSGDIHLEAGNHIQWTTSTATQIKEDSGHLYVDGDKNVIVRPDWDFIIREGNETYATFDGSERQLRLSGSISSSGDSFFGSGSSQTHHFTGSVHLGRDINSQVSIRGEIDSDLTFYTSDDRTIGFGQNLTSRNGRGLFIIGDVGYAGEGGDRDGGNVVIVGGKKQSSGTDGDVILGISASVQRGKVGIGIESPTSTLHISDGSTSGVSSLSVNDRVKVRGDGVTHWGASGNQGLLSWDTEKVMIGGQSSNDLELYANNSAKMFISGSGNVGIGTTSPTQKLSVAGHINLTSNSYALWTRKVAAMDGNGLALHNDGGEGINIQDNNDVNISAGKLGVGVGSPSEALQVEGNISASGWISASGGINSNQLMIGAQTALIASGALSESAVEIQSTSDTLLTLRSSGYSKGFNYPSRSYGLYVTKSNSYSSNNAESYGGYIDVTGYGSSNNYNYGLYSMAQKKGGYGYATYGLVGHSRHTQHNYSTTNTDLIGVQSIVDFYTTASILTSSGDMFGFRSTMQVQPGKIIQNTYGLYLDPVRTTGGGVVSASRFGIYQSGVNELNYFQGKVGIGTTSPSRQLEVEDTDDTYIKIESTAANSDSGIKITNDAQQWRIYNWGAATDKLNFRAETAGNSVLTMTTDGKVGIGTTSPATELTVTGDISASGYLYAGLDNTTTGHALRLGSTGATEIIHAEKNHLVIKTSGAKNITFQTDNNEEKMKISNDGEVRISGSISASGDSYFGSSSAQTHHFTGSVSLGETFLDYISIPGELDTGITFKTTEDKIIKFGNNLASRDGRDLTIIGDQGFAGEGGNKDGGNIYLVGGDAANSGDDGNVILGMSGSTSRGKVGIGTNTPSELLTVGGEISASDNITTDGKLMVGDTSIGSEQVRVVATAAGSGSGILVYESGSISGTRRNRLHIGADYSGSYLRSNYSSGGSTDIRFMTWNTERMRITSDGKIGIGTDNPQYTLEVSSGTTNEIARFASTDDDGLISIGDDNDMTYIGYDHSKKNMSLGFDNGMGATNLTISSSGKLGIGTTSPEAGHTTGGGLTIFNNGTMASTASAEAARVSSSLLLKASDNQFLAFDMNEISHFGDNLHIAAMGNATNDGNIYIKANANSATSMTTRMFISSSGNIGIGTTNPNEKLEVDGNISGSGWMALGTDRLFSSKITINGDGFSTGGWKVGTSATYVGKLYNNAGVLSLETDTNRDIQLGDSGTPAVMYIDTSAEEVGIGTTNPGRQLHISSSGVTRVAIDGAAGSNARLHFNEGGIDTWNLGMVASDKSFTFYDSQNSLSPLKVFVSSSSNTLVLSGSKVGIGTLSPDEKLDVDGNIKVTSISASGHLLFEDDFHMGYYGDGFNIAETGVSDYRLFIKEGGNIGIGTNTPPQKLTVEGSISASGNLYVKRIDDANDEGGNSDLTIAPQNHLYLGTTNTDHIHLGRQSGWSGGNIQLYANSSTPVLEITNQKMSIGTSVQSSETVTLEGSISSSGDSYFGTSSAQTHRFTGSVDLGYSVNDDIRIIGEVKNDLRFKTTEDRHIAWGQNLTTRDGRDLVIMGDTGYHSEGGSNDGGNIYIVGGDNAAGGGSYGDVILGMSGSTSRGYVGIGIEDPTQPLDVYTSDDNVARFRSSDNKSIVTIADNDTTTYLSSENGRFSIGSNTGTNVNNGINVDITTTPNNVGIGCQPTVALQVGGEISASGNIYGANITASGLSIIDGGSASFGEVEVADWIYHTGNTDTKIGFPTGDKIDMKVGGINFMRAWQKDSDVDKLYFSYNQDPIDFIFRTANNNPGLFISASGQVGINGAGAGTEALTVEGNISASGNVFVEGDISASGDIIARNYIVSNTVTQMTTSYSSGSTISGDDITDTHQFTGSLLISGSIDASLISGSSTTTASYGKSIIGSIEGSTEYGNLIVKSDTNHMGITIEENSGNERWNIGVDSAGDLNFHNSDVTATTPSLTIQDSTNYVGIGTHDPDTRLTISGSSNEYITIQGSGSGYTSAALIMKTYRGSNRPSGMYMRSMVSDNTWYAGRTYGTNGFGISYQPNSDAGGSSYFYSAASYVSSSFFIQPDGDIGIGTTSPTEKLHISSSDTNAVLNIESSGENAYLKIVSNTDDQGGEESGILLYDNTSAKWEVFKTSGNHFAIHDYARGANSFQIATNGNMSLMHNGGSVGIGTSVAAKTLTIAGDISSSGDSYFGSSSAQTHHFTGSVNLGYSINDDIAIKGEVKSDLIFKTTEDRHIRWGQHLTSRDGRDLFIAGDTGYHSEGGSNDGGNIYIISGKKATGGGTDGNILLGVSESVSRGKVGIKTTTPTHELTVSGSISASNDLYIGDDITAVGDIRGATIGMTNIVTNRVPYYNGTQLDDSVMYSRNDGIDVEGNITASGTISSSGLINGLSGSFGNVSILNSNAGANPRLKVGRTSNQSIDFSVIDLNNTITANQDSDTDGDHKFILDREFDGSGANDFTIRKGGSDQLLINTSGNVGIGTSSPTKKLEVAGDISASGNIYLRGSNGIYFEDDNQTYIEVNGDDILRTVVGNHQVTTIKSAKFGIGTTDPQEKLTVGGSISASGDINIQGDISASDGTRALQYDISAHALKSSGQTLDINGTDISFNTDDLYIEQSTSRVGIGTTDPSSPLDVVGSSGRAADFTSDNDAPILVYSTDNTTGITFKDDSDEQQLYYRGDRNIFYIENPTKLGLGTNDPSETLDVQGSASFSGNITASGDINIQGNISSSGELWLNDGNIRSNNHIDFVTFGGSANHINIGKLGMSGSYAQANTTVDAMATTNAAMFGGDVSVGPHGNGKLGVNKLIPTKELEVDGDISASGDLYIDGKWKSENLTFDTNTNTTISIPTAGGGTVDGASLTIQAANAMTEGGGRNGGDIILKPGNKVGTGRDGRISSSVDFYTDGNISASGEIFVGTNQKLYLNKGEDTYIQSMAGDIARVVAGGNQMMIWDYDTGNRAVFGNGTKVYIGNNNNYLPTEALVVDGNISASGDIIARNYIVNNTVTAMTTSFSSGSTMFGDDVTDTHQFTGSLLISGSSPYVKIKTGDADTTAGLTYLELTNTSDAGGYANIKTSNSSLYLQHGTSRNIQFGYHALPSSTANYDLGSVTRYFRKSYISQSFVNELTSSQITISDKGHISASSGTGSFGKLIVNVPSPTSNDKLIEVQNNGSTKFSVDEDGDIVTAGVLQVGSYVYNNTGNNLVLGGGGDVIIGMDWDDGSSNNAIKFTKNELSLTPSNTLMTILESGNVGIGKTAPTKPLEVVGDISSSGTMYSDTGSYGQVFTNQLYHQGDNDTGIEFDDDLMTLKVGGSGMIGMVESSTDYIYTADNANVQIGKLVTEAAPRELTVEGSYSGSGDIDIQGNISASNITASGHIQVDGRWKSQYLTFDKQDTQISIPDSTGNASGKSLTLSAGDGSTETAGSQPGGNIILEPGSRTGNGIPGIVKVVGDISGSNISASGHLYGSDMYVDEYIYHKGDSDTYLLFDTNIINLVAGGWSGFKIDKNNGWIRMNNTNQDLDFQVNADDGNVVLHTDAGDNRVGINTTTPTHDLTVEGSISASGTIYADSVVGTMISKVGSLISESAQVNHDSTANFVANEHIDHSSVTMTAGSGLTGGGTIASNRTFNIGAGTGVTVNANDVAIGQDVATTADVTFNNITSSNNISGSYRGTGSFGTVHTYGDIGIGTITPTANLHIQKYNPDILLQEGAPSTEFMKFSVITNDARIGWDDGDDLHLGVYSSPTDSTLDTKVRVSGPDGTVHIDEQLYAKTFRQAQIFGLRIALPDATTYYFGTDGNASTSSVENLSTYPHMSLQRQSMCDTKVTKVKMNFRYAVGNVSTVKMKMHKYNNNGTQIDGTGNYTQVGTEWTVTSSDISQNERFYTAPSDWEIDAGDIYVFSIAIDTSNGSTSLCYFNGSVLLEEDWNNQVSS